MERLKKVNWLVVAVVLAFLLFAAWALFGEEAPHVRQPELKVLCWKIWYSSKVVTCKQVTWDKAPADDVQATVIWYAQTYHTFSDGKWREEHYRHICSGEDYYYLDGCGSADEAAAYKGPHSVKLGKWTSDRNFQRIYNRAMKDLRPPQ